LLRDAYGLFGKGDIEGFLATCTDDVTFSVPGSNAMSGEWNREGFAGEFVQRLMGHTQGTFREEIVELVANDDHGVLLLDHHFERGGKAVDYRTAHVIAFRNGKISAWREWPGDMAKFEEAWTP
jgi:ketosteroid isomerase-like protein